MTRRYVEIRYTDCVERVPLPDLGQLRRSWRTADRTSATRSIRAGCTGWSRTAKGKTVYEAQVSPQTDRRH